jgi:hypothetical protein
VGLEGKNGRSKLSGLTAGSYGERNLLPRGNGQRRFDSIFSTASSATGKWCGYGRTSASGSPAFSLKSSNPARYLEKARLREFLNDRISIRQLNLRTDRRTSRSY